MICPHCQVLTNTQRAAGRVRIARRLHATPIESERGSAARCSGAALCVRLFQTAGPLLVLPSDSVAAREQCNRWTASATWTRQHCTAEQPPLIETQISAVYYFTLFTRRLLSPRCSASKIFAQKQGVFGRADRVVEQDDHVRQQRMYVCLVDL